MNLLHQRLYSQGLHSQSFASVRDVVAHMGCMQAQYFTWSLWNIGLRAPGLLQQDVLDALNNGDIVRTWPMRGTLHLMLPEDVHWMLDLCASKTLSGFQRRREFLGMSDAHADTALQLLDSMLRGGKALTREEMVDNLKIGGIPMTGQWGYHLINYAATNKLVCFGPRRGKKDTIVLLDERVKNPKKLSYEESLAAYALMYFKGHGPATLQDLVRRGALSVKEGKLAIELVKDQLETLDYLGQTHYMIPQEKNTKTGHESVIFLGGFDEYFIGYKDRSAISQPDLSAHYYSINGIFFPLILVDGYVVGTWKRNIKKDKVMIECTIRDTSRPFDEKNLLTAGQRYANFLGISDVHCSIV